jgi:nicotinamide-nucleotide amidase
VDLDVPREHAPPSRIFALPGVPAEMKRMFRDTVSPRILEASGGNVCIRQNVMKLFGTGESDLEERLGDMISRDRQPRVGITVSAATISLRITATAESEERCIEMIADTRREIRALVGEFYFGDGESFEQYHAIDETLCALGQSLLVIELGHAAPLGDWFASLGETSSYRGGLSLAVADDLRHLTSTDDTESALDHARQQFRADWLLMVDGYPSLDAASDQPMPASEVAFVVIDPTGKKYHTSTTIGGHPNILQARIGKAAMQWLRKVLARSE